MFAGAGAARAAEVIDIEGRRIAAPDAPRRLLLGDGHLVLALALVHPDPISLIAAWHGDFVRHSAAIVDMYRTEFPRVDDIPVVGQASPDTFSVEAALEETPDLALLGGCYGPGPRTPETVRRLEDAGIPVIFLDFFIDPLKNTAPSMRALGRALGGDAVEKAEAFAGFHEARLKTIADRLAKAAPARPSILLQAHAGVWDCCWMPGNAGLGTFIDFAGGTNIGSAVSSLPWIQGRLEFVLEKDPDVFVTTGGPHLRGRNGLVAGPGVGVEEARSTLETAVSGNRDLTAVEKGRVHGFWHLLHDTPINIVAVEALAKWLHPDLFSDLDPEATMAEINHRFFSIPLPGTYTADLR